MCYQLNKACDGLEDDGTHSVAKKLTPVTPCLARAAVRVTQLCLGNIGHARGAAAVRLAKMEPEPEVAVAQVTVLLLLGLRLLLLLLTTLFIRALRRIHASFDQVAELLEHGSPRNDRPPNVAVHFTATCPGEQRSQVKKVPYGIRWGVITANPLPRKCAC